MKLPPAPDELRAAFADAAAPEGASCTPPTALWDAVVGALPAVERRAVVAHTAACPRCAQLFRLASALAIEAGLSIGGTEVPRRGRRRLAVATAVAVASAAALLALAPRIAGGPQAAFRSPPGLEVQALSPAALPRGAFRLRWSPLGRGATYALTVTTPALDPVFEVRALAEPEATVPPESLAGLPPGTTLVWVVEATLSDRRHLASAAFTVRLE